jgi:hypothetical protein
MLLMIRAQGAEGAAGAWVLLNAGYVAFEVPIMHRRLLQGEAARWYLRDTGPPLLCCVAVGAAARWLLPADISGWLMVLAVTASYAAMLTAATLAAPGARQMARELHARFRNGGR